ncbi:MAG: methyltransferase domain-containing protein [Solirubrobacteraceae bacterium]
MAFGGVNLIGHLRADGLAGHFARAALLALDEADIPVYPIALPGAADRDNGVPRTADAAGAPFALNLVCAADPGALPPGDVVRWWTDEPLWGAVALPIALPPRGLWPDRGTFNLPDGWLALVLLEVGEDRPELLSEALAAFAAAFPDLGAERLVVHAPRSGPAVREALAGRPEVVVVVDDVDDWERGVLIAGCNCVLDTGAEPLAALASGHAALLGLPVAHDAEGLRAARIDAPELRAQVARERQRILRDHAPAAVGRMLRDRLQIERPLVGAADVLPALLSAERRQDRDVARLEARLSDVIAARDILENRVQHVLTDPTVPPGHVVAVASPMADLVARHPPVDPPWTLEYNAANRALVAEAIAAPDLERWIVDRGALPEGFGRGYDERVVEYPWVMAQGLGGRTLDAGSVFNHPHVLEPVLREVTTLDIVTLAPEQWSFPELGATYVYADLRDLPYRDGHFETIVCVSTLDHVGMDNAEYGIAEPRATDPATEVDRAVAELVRVLAPGGRLLITVPYGAPEDHGWLRQFDQAGVARIVAAAAPLSAQVEVFGYDTAGWRRGTLEDQAQASYRDFLSDQRPVSDGAVAARAVACIRLQRI